MNRTEQKTRLEDIIELANEVLLSIRAKESILNVLLEKVELLDEDLQHLEYDDIFDDVEEIQTKILNAFFEREFKKISCMLVNFKDEINKLMCVVSSSEAKVLEDKYYELELVIETFSQATIEYDSVEYAAVDYATEQIQDAIFMLKEMII